MWSIENMDDAKRKWEFIIVSSPSDTRVNIVDVHRLWTYNPQILFQTGYRIAGTPEDITNNLKASGTSDEDINALIASSITSSNYYNTMKEIYDSEVKSYKSWKKSVLKSNINSEGFTLLNLTSTVNPSRLKLTELPVIEKVKRRGKVKPLLTKISELTEGKVINVSGILSDGSNTKSMPAPKPGARTKFVGTDNLPIVSDNVDSYILAVSMLPGGVDQYQNDIELVKQLLGQKQTSSPKSSSSSPKFAPSPNYYSSSSSSSPPKFAPSPKSSSSSSPKFNVPLIKPIKKSPFIEMLSKLSLLEMDNFNRILGGNFISPSISYDNFINIIYNYYINNEQLNNDNDIQLFFDSELNQLFNDSLIDKNMLDVESGNGIIGKLFAEQYGLNPTYSGTIKYTNLEPFILFSPTEQIDTDKRFGVVTLFHLLEQIQTEELLQGRIADIYNKLIVGGLFVIRQYDVLDETIKKKIELIQILYDLSQIEKGRSKEEIMNWIDNYSLLLYNKETLNNIISSLGFQLLGTTSSTEDNVYYSLYQRIEFQQ